MTLFTAVERELLAATKSKRRDGESDQKYFARLAGVVDRLKEPEWAKLSEDAQQWAEKASKAINANEDIPGFDGKAGKKEEEAEEPAKEEKARKDRNKGKGKDKDEDPEPDEKPKKGKDAKKGKDKDEDPEPDEKPAVGKSGSRSFKPEQVITIKAKENPFREGSKLFKRFAVIKSGMTVAAAIKAGARPSTMRIITTKGYATIK